MKHHHGYRVSSRSGKEFHFKCKCGKEYRRAPTKAEYKRFMGEFKVPFPGHRVWHAFLKRFRRYKKEPVPKKMQEYFKGKFRSIEDGWKYQGYDFMVKIREWAKKYPKDVYVCGIDDSFHASSDIVFILHRESPRVNWGTSVVVITQCDGQPPKEYFMYPGHLEGIMEVFLKIGKMKSKRY